jgi:hypothetical protein
MLDTLGGVLVAEIYFGRAYVTIFMEATLQIPGISVL